MAQPSAFVDRYRTQVTKTMEELLKLKSMSGDEYEALGGSAFVAPFFKDADGKPRTDLDITQEAFEGGIASAQKLTAIAVGDFQALVTLRT